MGGCSDPKAKVTIMVLKVDLDCCQCYKKVKSLLCQFPQIRNQVYDEKTNTVTITVVCCSPENIRDKLCCKGGKSIKSIEIKEPKKSEHDTKLKTEKHTERENQCVPRCRRVPICCERCYHGVPGGPCYEGYGRPPYPNPVLVMVPVPVPVPCEKKKQEKSKTPSKSPDREVQCVQGHPRVFPASISCERCYHGVPGGPCYEGYGRPPCSPGYYVCRCDYLSEENPNACSIM